MLTTVEAFRALVRPLPISPTTFAPIDAVQAAITLARQEAERPDAVVHLTPAPSGTVHGDRVLLEEAIAAVVRNAIEASALVSPTPAVEVSVAQASAARSVEIVVTDRGPGVPEDVRARVFQPFLTDKPGHAGLGLARAAQVLRAHPGASIALEHPPAGGLVVTLGAAAARLIAAATQELRLRPPPPARLLRRRAGGPRARRADRRSIFRRRRPLDASTPPAHAGSGAPSLAPARARGAEKEGECETGAGSRWWRPWWRWRWWPPSCVSVSTALVASRAMAVHDRDQAIGRVAAQARLATLTSLAFHTIAGADGSAVAVTDTTTDVSGEPPGPGGTGLGESPADALWRDRPGYVDYLDATGRDLGRRAGAREQAAYVRRWVIGSAGRRRRRGRRDRGAGGAGVDGRSRGGRSIRRA